MPPAESPSAKAQRLQRESLSLLDLGKNDQALTRLGEALSIDPGLKPAGPQAVALRDQLLTSYHERAILLYRDQQLDQAITLWDRILSINPNYEPAVIYRARALELKHRLKQI
jgi:tetratricopeptide (TPR) repeat protein